MSLFKRRGKPQNKPLFPPGQFEPVIRSSICSGEMTACMRNKETGKLYEIMVIRNDNDLKQFSEEYGVDAEQIRTVY